MADKSKANGSNRADQYHIECHQKDSVIDLIKTECQIDSGGSPGSRIPKAYLEKLSHESGVGVTTIRNWLFGDTKHPRHLSTRFVLEALGVTTRRYRRDGTEIKSNW